MKMRAVLCEKLGWPATLPVAEVAVPQPGAGQMLVEVAAAGLNFADQLLIGGSYQEKMTPPFVPGAELAGTVVEVAPDVTRFRVGDRVMGQVNSGAYAEFALLDAHRAQYVPSRMPFDEAAGFFIPYGTAACGLYERARLKEDETVLVTGAAGGVGRAAVELAKARGRHVIAIASGEQRRSGLRDIGGITVFDTDASKLNERVKDATAGAGVDIVFDVVGGKLAQQAMRTLRVEGRFVMAGFASGDLPELRANHLLVKNIDVVGFYWGAYQARFPDRTDALFEDLRRLYVQGVIKPHTSARFPIEQFNEAMAELLKRKHIGKIIMDPKL
ncbi:NADPH:quinone oxidoreductase family protein [Rhodobacteraceae bacterium D3-12]|nr:NADPH:quinone oxidoreductase family protein [Rhodobacteraceae bacterium D3-12]